MGLKPQNIGTAMPHGQAGSYARQPEMIVGTKPLGGTKAVAFGTPLEYDEAGNVVAMGQRPQRRILSASLPER